MKRWSLVPIAVAALLAGLSGCRSDQNALYEALQRQQTPIPEAVALEIERDGARSTETVNYFSLADFDESVFALSDSDEPLAIIDVGPREELPVEIRRPTIYVLFNQPMVPLSKLGDPMTESDLLSIEPAVDGIYRWYGSRILAFEPAEPFESQRRYTVTASEQATSLGGKQLGQAFSWEFRSERLRMADAYPGEPLSPEYIDRNDAPPFAARQITVSFTYPVNMEHVAEFLTVTAAGRDYPFVARRPENDGTLSDVFMQRSIVLDLEDSFPEDTEVTVTLGAGAASEPDYLGREEPQQLSFHTLRPFDFAYHSAYSWSFPRSEQGDSNPVYLVFSHPVFDDAVHRHLEVSLPDNDLADNVEVWGKTIKINNLPVDYDTTYRITISPELTDVYGRPLGMSEVVEVHVPNAQSYYYFPNTGTRMLESQFAPNIVWEYQNIFDGVWKVDSTDDPYQSFAPEELEPYDFSELQENVKHYETFDLSPWLGDDGTGSVALSWNFAPKNQRGERNTWSQRNLQVQVTDLGVTTRYAFNKALIWVHSLSDGTPISAAQVRLTHYGDPVSEDGPLSATTDETGLAIFEFEPQEYRKYFRSEYSDHIQIGVEYGGDRVEFRPNESHNPYRFGVYDTASPVAVENSRMETFLFTDRGLYKPGETVTFRGIDRTWSAGNYSVYTGPYRLVAKEFTYQAVPFVELQGRTSTSGGFYGEFQVPDDLAPGTYAIEYERQGTRTSIPFQVAYFRRLAFQVALTAPDRPFFAGEEISIPAKATYLAGGALGGGTYRYFWAAIPSAYVPPGTEWEPYEFGPDDWGNRRSLSSGEGALSPVGEAFLSQQTSDDGIAGKPYTYRVEARVQDIDRQEVAGSASVLVHPASVYIGAKLADEREGYWSTFLSTDEEASLHYAFVDIDGEPTQAYTDARVELIKHTWKVAQQQGVYGRVNTRYELVHETVGEDELPSGRARGSWAFTPEQAGRYTLRLTALDASGRTAVTELSFYATGSEWVRWGADSSDEITLVPDRDTYLVGDTARIMVQSPLPEGRYLITTEREGIFDERVVELDGSANVIEVPITDEHVPVIYVAISSFTARTAPPTGYFEPDLGKPKGYFGIAALAVSPQTRTLDVEVTPSASTYLPGGRASVTVRVTDDGRPVRNAEVTFLAVDRGVLDLIDYHVPDPVAFFYDPSKFPLAVRGADSRSLLIDPVLYEVKNLQGGDDEGGKLDERSDFRPLAVFEPFLSTDENGVARTTFTLPDTLTTYRATAVVVNHQEFGIQEAELLVQNPLNVRSILPRRLRLRDTSRAAVVLTNLSDERATVSVSLETDGLTIEGEPTQEVRVDAGSSLEVAFPVVATREGEAQLVFTVRSPLLSERVAETLTVQRPLVTEAFTVIGRTDGRSAQEGLVIPSAIAPDYGGLTVSLNSSRLGSIEEAIRYLVEYPHGYLDHQLTTNVPQILFGQALSHFSGGDYLYVDGRVEAFFDQLNRYQLADGGFSYNPRYYSYSSPYVSTRVAHYYALALDNGYPVEESIDIGALLGYLRSIQSRPYSAYVRLYALYVRSIFGDNVTADLDREAQAGDELGISGYGFLGLAYHERGRSEDAARMLARMRQFTRPSTRGMDLTETYEARYYFDSQVTSLALLLMLQLAVDPEPEIVERITWQLQSMQRYGYWVNTSDTAWAVTAYARLIADEAGEETDMQVRVSVAETELMSESFEGHAGAPRVAEFGFFDAPLAEIARNELFPIRIERDGRGVAYYTATVRYALPSEIVPARDEGFSLYTRIEDLDGQAIEDSDLELGRTYRMRVTASTSRSRIMVALRVPVPSGVDILDASFVTTASYGDAGGVDGRSWSRETTYGETTDYSAEGAVSVSPFGVVWDYYRPVKEIYDNEVRYYFDQFYPGRQQVTFLFRTTTAGVYPTPPAHVEAMYEPEVFGRSAGLLYVIEE